MVSNASIGNGGCLMFHAQEPAISVCLSGKGNEGG